MVAALLNLIESLMVTLCTYVIPTVNDTLYSNRTQGSAMLHEQLKEANETAIWGSSVRRP